MEASTIVMPAVYEPATGHALTEHLDSTWPDSTAARNRVRRLQLAGKWMLDISLAVLGLGLLALALPAIALAIFLDCPGPVFYVQTRVGKGGKLFSLYKFRSMVPGAENGHALWAEVDDPRVTRVGRLLRRTHLDELPQFLNILKGEMSLVGPRPERPEFVEQLAREIPSYHARHQVKPGATGWALVMQGYGGSKEDSLRKLQYDLYYIRHWSLRFDVLILAKTLAVMLKFEGR